MKVRIRLTIVTGRNPALPSLKVGKIQKSKYSVPQKQQNHHTQNAPGSDAESRICSY
jgi:hypothetical protein